MYISLELDVYRWSYIYNFPVILTQLMTTPTVIIS